MSRISKIPDPKQEALRELGLKEWSIRDISNLKEKTVQVHTGWLFDDKGKETLQMLCRCLGATKDSYLFPGWEDLGIRLGLNSDVLKCIRWSPVTTQGASYDTFLAYVQDENATLDRVLEALKEIGRHDIIEKTYSHFDNLADQVLPAETSNEESGYFSLSNGQSDEDLGTIRRNIIKPRYIPVPPLVLQNLNVSNQQCNAFTRNVTEITKESDQCAVPTNSNEPQSVSNQQCNAFTRNVTEITKESYQCAVPTNSNEPQSTHKAPKFVYNCTVMLTFALDGLEYAQEIATALRKKREDGMRIGVVILDEHTDIVHSNPEQFIMSCFNQVRYVIPVITEGYLRGATSTAPPQQRALECVDTTYVRRIYDLMTKHYGYNGCLNKKIRCVVPDHMVYLTQEHWLMRDPLFAVWERLSNIKELGDRMLHARI